MGKVSIAGREVNPIGLGTLHMGDDPSQLKQELKAIRTGLDNGVQVLDTAEMYGSGNSEKFLSKAIEPYKREDLFLISKVLPPNASKKQLPISLENSLKRLNVDYLDLYLLHWQGQVPLEETVEALEKAKNQGKIRAWGVSNLDTNELKNVISLPEGKDCSANQLRYNLRDRGIEYDLIPEMNQYNIPVIAYAPVDRGKQLVKETVIQQIAEKHGVDAFQILLAWTIRNGNTIAIPQSSNEAHVYNNIQAANIKLSEDDLKKIDKLYPKPTSKQPLALW
ncbi:aldo/keto reductase [Tetragenococcus koreensis]|uniref:aldo/keto reductase n=1 Tax=Tetragenococcus koreensis TaxID=290335 RepID=UPI001F2FB3DA|nr:aldo/keto reductase [Tetragenococcus koreensis]MCF1618307.1 aldo/keto reductase [Tetragenococcus koreensis]MCF1623094.1 aldo/keto reductase [Tetragenococcus koreensis]MCF1627424.1 aldo/keto reductase [Tetragenococcus koreensis]MCF1632981.1 aldo/keto reductase [Tetragenococcus koreensis]MCF1679111.1 aldo/keto reductase [Tetragenococcus koreensis]